MKRLGWLALALATLSVAVPTVPIGRAGATAPVSITQAGQMALGNPDGATAKAGETERWLIVRPQYALSYSGIKLSPNWVSWTLDGTDIGHFPRSVFWPERALPQGIEQVKPSDYNGVGYDRGHLCPSDDRTASAADNLACFTMANITPQIAELNRGPWERLEAFTRDLAKAGNTCYVLAGPEFPAAPKTIGRRLKIAVPSACWKVIVVEPRGHAIDASARVIAVQMPNTPGVSTSRWQAFLCTPAEIERATGFNLFSALPPAVAAGIRTRKDAGL